jgi:uncharacterized LabA/DUF88 family protein/cold shock CspA family protein
VEKRKLDLLRIGIFYDGYYFYKVSNYYKYVHPRRARISIAGLHEFIRNESALVTGVDIKQCQIIDSHYFRGRYVSKEVNSNLLNERIFENILMRENIVTHYLPLKYNEKNGLQEKGIDVWLALEAYELTLFKKFDIVVLVACDGDYVPLVRKLHTIGAPVMLISWDFTYHNVNGNEETTKTSQQLLEEVFHPLFMHDKIDAGAHNEFVKNLFVSERYNDYPPNATSVQPAENYNEQEFFSTILSVKDGFGFIRDDSFNNIYFNYETLINENFDELREGMKVKYLREEDMERTKNEGAIRYRAVEVSVVK